jgi:transcriptional regulator with XRE-family HTH domain
MNLSIGDKIKRLRVEKKISQEALAKALYFSNRTISNWENNLREVSISNLQKLANYFQVPITYFTEETLTSLPKNGTYQQIKVKKIALSDRYFYFLFVLYFVNASFLWVPFQNRLNLAALLMVFYVGLLIVTIGRYTNLDRQRTKSYFVDVNSKVKYLTNYGLKYRRQFKLSVVLHYLLVSVVTLFFYLGIYTMINHLPSDTDAIMNLLLIGFISFMTLIHLFIIFREFFSGIKQEELPYSKEQYDFGMTIHRSVVTLHYAMVIFILVYLNAYGASPFSFDLLLFVIINGLALIVLLRMTLLMITNFFDSYRLIIDDLK